MNFCIILLVFLAYCQIAFPFKRIKEIGWKVCNTYSSLLTMASSSSLLKIPYAVEPCAGSYSVTLHPQRLSEFTAAKVGSQIFMICHSAVCGVDGKTSCTTASISISFRLGLSFSAMLNCFKARLVSHWRQHNSVYVSQNFSVLNNSLASIKLYVHYVFTGLGIDIVMIEEQT